MPIKELIAFAVTAAISIALSGGPGNAAQKVRIAGIHLLREAARVDNWGNPTIRSSKKRVRTSY